MVMACPYEFSAAHRHEPASEASIYCKVRRWKPLSPSITYLSDGRIRSCSWYQVSSGSGKQVATKIMLHIIYTIYFTQLQINLYSGIYIQPWQKLFCIFVKIDLSIQWSLFTFFCICTKKWNVEINFHKNA